MYPVKRSYPVKASATASSLYPVKKAGNLNHQSPSPSGTQASPTSYSAKTNVRQSAYATPHTPRADGSSVNLKVHTDKSDYAEKRQKLDVQSSPRSKGEASSSLQPKPNIQSKPQHKPSAQPSPSRKPSAGSDPAAQSLRKGSPGDPSNPGYIHGLTIHLPQTYKVEEPYDLMTLFESCSRSRKRLRMETFGQGLSNISSKVFIQDKYICTGSGWSSRKSRDDGAMKALDILCKFQPYRYNTSQEMMLHQDNADKIEGLRLGLTSANPTKDECLDVIMDSCIDSNLPVTWWDDGGGKVFGDGRGTVLLINGKPICWGIGEGLDDAMKETAMRAIQVLKRHHLAAATMAAAAGNKDSAKRKLPENNLEKASGASQAPTESPSKKRKTVNLLEDNAPHSPIRVPNLTIYLPMNTEKLKQLKHPLFNLLESFFRCNITAHMECNGIAKGVCESKLWIEDKTSDRSLMCTGTGVDKKDSRNDAAQKALQVLRKSHPCVYNKREEMFVRHQDLKGAHQGLKLYLSSEEGETPLSQLTKSCEKCKFSLSWWHDGGGHFYGHPWTAVLLINSRPLCWGHGFTLDAAKLSTAATAVERLKETHPIVRGDEADKEPEASTKEPEATTKQPVANLKVPDPKLSTGKNQADDGYLKTAIPGLTIYVAVNTYNTENALSVEHAQNRHAKSTILRSVNRCNMKVNVQDVPPEKVVHKNRGFAANLFIGDVLVACGYGKNSRVAAQWNAWQVSFDILMRTQAVVYEPDTRTTSANEKKADTEKGSTSTKNTATTQSNNSVKPTGVSEQSYVQEKLKNSVASVSALLSPAVETKQKNPKGTIPKPMKFTVHSEWIDRKAKPSELKMNEKSNELISKYLQFFNILNR